MATNVTVPQCSAHVSASEYNAQAQANFDVTSWGYYKTYVESAEVLPGLIIGGLCWVVALVFIVWLFLLCCRSVGWRSRRTRVHDIPAKGRNKWAAFNVLMFVVVLGVVGTGTWALVEGIKSTDGDVQDFWNIVGSIESQLQNISTTVQSSSTTIQDLQTSVTASYTLINNNQAAASAGGLNVPATLSELQSLESTLASGLSGAQEAESNIQGTGVVKIENLQNKWESRTVDGWQTWRVVAVAVFFGLLILFGVAAGFLALLDRNPRLTATLTLLLWIWTGFVLILGAGVLSLVWRVSRDGCLYGVDYATTKIGGGSNTKLVLDYYFQRVSIAPQDVSQDLFKVNLTAIISNLTDPTLASIVAAVSTSGGQALLSTASASDEAAINALSGRITSLSNNLTTLDNQILASNFVGISTGVQSLICCSTTNGLWNLWLASIITGAVAAFLAILCLIKVVTAIHPLGSNHHYTPHDPNGTISSSKGTSSSDKVWAFADFMLRIAVCLILQSC